MGRRSGRTRGCKAATAGLGRSGEVTGLPFRGYGRSMRLWGGTAMEVTIERRDGVLWLSVSGRITILNATEFEEAVAGAIEDGDRAVIMDFENVIYISSMGLYAVLKTAKHLWRRDAAFALCAMSAMILDVFQRVGFHRIMAIHPTRAAALASLSA